jgi:predicted outer membrane repeat protein
MRTLVSLISRSIPFLGSATRRPVKRATSSRRRPLLETLEGRTLLAVFPVNTFQDTLATDHDQRSLRLAIQQANQLSSASTIMLPPGTYVLTQGELAVSTPPGYTLTIETDTSKGPGVATIDAQGASRLFDVTTPHGDFLDLEGLDLKNGFADEGGAVNDNGWLFVNNCTFENNNATFGGAIYTSN